MFVRFDIGPILHILPLSTYDIKQQPSSELDFACLVSIEKGHK